VEELQALVWVHKLVKEFLVEVYTVQLLQEQHRQYRALPDYNDDYDYE